MKGKISAYHLKLFALLFMVIDHIHTNLGVGPYWVSILPRFVAPLFTFFIVEGFFKTSSRKNYIKRTFLFALIMQAGNIIINIIFNVTDYYTGKMTFYSVMEGNNIFLTLGVFLLLMTFLEKIRKKEEKIKNIFLFILFSFLTLFTEGGLELYPVLLIMYFFYGNKKKISIGIALWSLLLFIKAYISYYTGATGLNLIRTLSFSAEWAIVFVIPFIYLYSGERGRNDFFAKWMFYIIYPLHLWILYIIRLGVLDK